MLLLIAMYISLLASGTSFITDKVVIKMNITLNCGIEKLVSINKIVLRDYKDAYCVFEVFM